MLFDVTERLLAHGNVLPINSTAAKTAWAIERGRDGVPLLTLPSDNAKLSKSARPSYGLSLMPAAASGYEVCNYRTAGCTEGCVAYSGAYGTHPKVTNGRTYKTRFLMEHPRSFVTLLANEIGKAARKHGSIAVRLNAFSDIPWEEVTPWLFDRWPKETVQFYDYTKWGVGMRKPPSNYDLTYSVTERDPLTWLELALEHSNERYAVVVPAEDVDRTDWRGHTCVSGDKSDERWLDPKPALVLLKAKGKMRGANNANPMVRRLWREIDVRSEETAGRC